MTETYYEEDEEAPPPVRARSRFDPTKERDADTFVRAHRHSRRVGWLKIGLPAVAIAGIGGFVAFMEFAPAPTEAVISLSGVNVEDKSVEMQSPHISGFDGTKTAYEVTAIKATQDLDNPKIMTLHTLTANFGVGNDETATVKATTGVYDGTTKGLVLKDGVTLDTSKGHHAQFEDATIDLDSGHLVTENPVQIEGVEGKIKAKAMEVFDKGARVIFSHGVSVTYIPKDPGPAQPDAAPAADKPAAAPATTGDGA
jgi:lipopolysaccharide export system protein LptC